MTERTTAHGDTGTVVPAARLVDATKHYRRGAETVIAVDSASLELRPGLTVVIGASGSGKTTLLNLIIGWERPDHGSVYRTVETGNWADIAVVPQGLGLLDELSIAENISLPARLGVAQPVATDVITASLGLTDLTDRVPAETSLGEQQRTSLARALCVRPRLLVADEPTSHQDGANTESIVAHLVAAAESGTAVVVASHDPRVVTRGTQVFDMTDGRLTRRDVAVATDADHGA